MSSTEGGKIKRRERLHLCHTKKGRKITLGNNSILRFEGFFTYTLFHSSGSPYQVDSGTDSGRSGPKVVVSG